MKKLAAVAGIMMFLFTAAAYATVGDVESSKDVNLSFDIPASYGIQVDDGVSIVIGSETGLEPADVLNGFVETKGGTLNVTSNAAFILRVFVDSEVMTTDSNTLKPTSDLLVSIGDNVFYPISTSGVTLFTSNQPSLSTWSIIYRLLLSPTDGPGTYSTVVTYCMEKLI